MTTPVSATATAPRHEDAQVVGVACLLLAFEAADARHIHFTPLARLGDGFVAATVMINLGTGAMPFDLADVRLTASCLRADPPFAGAVALAATLALAADQAEAAAIALMGGLN